MPSNPDNPTNRPNTPLVSEYATDPDMQEILTLFIQEMPERVEALQKSWRASEFDQVKRLAHQLKGAGGGYGYPTLGEAAGKLEKSLNEAATKSHADSLESLRAQLDELVNLCNRVA